MDNGCIEYQHRPVLLGETLEALRLKKGMRYLDGTLGLGGHSEAILRGAPESQVCGIDCDGQALDVARERLAAYGGRAHLFKMRFGGFEQALQSLGWENVDGALLDLGVSSLQLDDASRGFSFNGDGRLDMRMDRDSGQKSAWHLVNRESFNNLKDCLALFGEEPQAGRIARFIVEARRKAPIDSTGQLAALVRRACPASWRGNARRHPATRTFQALRLAVNDELGQLRTFLEKILAWLAPGGRLVIISFHSLEDRIVKHAMRGWSLGRHCQGQLPVCACGRRPEARILYKKPLIASEQELAANPRASSAKLRAAEKLPELS